MKIQTVTGFSRQLIIYNSFREVVKPLHIGTQYSNEADVFSVYEWVYDIAIDENRISTCKIIRCGSPPGVMMADTLSFNKTLDRFYIKRTASKNQYCPVYM